MSLENSYFEINRPLTKIILVEEIIINSVKINNLFNIFQITDTWIMLSKGDKILGVEIDDIIGNGTFGRVYTATQRADKFMCCLKHVNLNLIKMFYFILFYFIFPPRVLILCYY